MYLFISNFFCIIEFLSCKIIILERIKLEESLKNNQKPTIRWVEKYEPNYTILVFGALKTIKHWFSLRLINGVTQKGSKLVGKNSQAPKRLMNGLVHLATIVESCRILTSKLRNVVWSRGITKSFRDSMCIMKFLWLECYTSWHESLRIEEGRIAVKWRRIFFFFFWLLHCQI